jgi:hypothetical protein
MSKAKGIFMSDRIHQQERASAVHRACAWLKLALGLAVIGLLAFVVLPWGQTLPVIRPIMETIAEANIDAGTYWYTQSEETARAQMYVRNATQGR